MKTYLFFALCLLSLASCRTEVKTEPVSQPITPVEQGNPPFTHGYAEVNGLRMYYEIYGQGRPLVLLHGGGSTIQTTFGRIIPQLARTRQLIAIELQAHGRTADRPTGLSFEQDADDVAALLKHLEIPKADIFGFSNGGTTALLLAIRHPDVVNKIVAASALAKRNGASPEFWEFMQKTTIADMPDFYKDAYKAVAIDSNQLQTMHDKSAQRMRGFKDIPDAQLKSIQAPTLIITGDKDVGTPEHAVELHHLIPASHLAIIPGGHGTYIGEITTLTDDTRESDFIIPIIESFLDEPTIHQ
jgi:pimeloyl-ACP methyl ester carboxylesterase